VDVYNLLITIGKVVEISMATAVASLTLTRSRAFMGFRHWVARWSSWLGELVACPYCMNHWIALLLVIAARWSGRLPDREQALSGLLLWLTVVGLASGAAKWVYLAVLTIMPTESEVANETVTEPAESYPASSPGAAGDYQNRSAAAD
jgi:hypothetical protein